MPKVERLVVGFNNHQKFVVNYKKVLVMSLSLKDINEKIVDDGVRAKILNAISELATAKDRAKTLQILSPKEHYDLTNDIHIQMV